MAREDGGRRDEVLFDSTGVLFRLPMADILSMMAVKLKLEEISWRNCCQDLFLEAGKSETKLSDLIRRRTSMH